ncbi:MAG: S8 family serine peptidase [Candidatus Sulfopaludibacter sp.]|nr:S8 family serine peptidase [Candidatus Sulfopaludibacter sp.]
MCAIFALVLFTLPIHAQIVPGRYTVMLADPPVSSRFASRDDLKSSAAIAYRQQVEAKQAEIVRNLESRGIRVTGSVSTLVNAVFVTAPSSRVAEIEGIPGVVAVKPMRRFKPTLNRAVQTMNMTAAWNVVGGQSNAGAGIKIGIIDSGIDQTHPAFQDPSLTVPKGFPICTTGHPEDCAFTTNKVIVARSYVRQLAMDSVTDPKNPAAQSQPDDYSPRDRFGHGTAVAACAAAFSATGPAVSSTGGAVSITGMAPKAWLGNYKIVGSSGVNDSPFDDVLIRAVEDAVNDGMDVVNMSWGGLSLSDAASDPVASAYEAAAQKIVVVLPSGDDGYTTQNNNEAYPYFESISSPGNAPSAITVGATLNSHEFNPTVSVTAASASSSLKGIAALPGDSYVLSQTGATTAPLVDITTLGDNGLACGTLPAMSLMGQIALIERGSCSFDQKAITAQTAGAVGVIFYMADSSALFYPTGISTDFIGPTVIISNSDGTALKQSLKQSSQQVTIDLSGAEQDLATFSQLMSYSPPLATNQLAGYSSVGPTPDGNIKPDLVATGGADVGNGTGGGLYMPTQSYDPTPNFGQDLTVFSPNRYIAADGTSFSSPITAGAAALLKQAHPNYTPAQIKSALVNAAAQDTTTDDLGNSVDVESIGAGRLDAGAAIGATVTAVPATLSFGILKAGGALPSKTITLTNTGSSSVTLSAAVSANIAATGTSVSTTPQNITIQPGASGTMTVALTGSVPAAGEYSGHLTLTGSGATVRLPYMFLVGTGTPNNLNPIYSYAAGYPGQDGGPLVIQVIDQYGVPAAGTSVTFTNATRGSVTLQSFGSGEPACSPTSSTSSVTCPTDQFGFAYVDVVAGTQVGAYTVNARVAGQTFQLQADVLDSSTLPAIGQGGVVNAATSLGTVAPGSYATIYGTNLLDANNLSNYSFYNNLSSDQVTGATIMSDGSFPISLDFTSVSFDVPGAGISVPGYVSFVSPNQVNVFVPWELANQSSVQVKVNVDEYNWGNVVTVPLANYNPGFFLNNGNVAAALDLNYQVISASNPAVRGQIIQLYANALGPVNPALPSGSPAPTTSLVQTTTTPVVTIGGQPATVSFSGLAPGFVGEYQVNVQVPTGLTSGNQPITIAIGGATSPSQTAGSSPQTIVIPVK